jgi:hypothetical protein
VGALASADIPGGRDPTVRVAYRCVRPAHHRVLDLDSWLYLHTLDSVLLATLFHGAINLSQGLFVGGIEGATQYWLLCIVYGVAALIAAFALGWNSLRKRAGASAAPLEARDV